VYNVANFERFKSRLQEQNADYSQGRAVTYVAIGDSVTQGCMEPNVIDHEHVSHQVLKRRILSKYPLAVFNVINSGISGDQAEASRTMWRRDVLMYQPDLVTISFGANDSHGGKEGLPSYIQAISDLIDALRNETQADIALLTPSMMMKQDNVNIPDCYRPLIPNFLKTFYEGYLETYVEALKQLAIEKNVALVDIYKIWKDMESSGVDIHLCMSNGLNHPDREFHEQIALAIETALFGKGVYNEQ
jgi:acyl-CoA thioesterase-1